MKKRIFYYSLVSIVLIFNNITTPIYAQTKPKRANINSGNTPAADKLNKEDCGDCDYFPLCNYDDTKSYEGKLYRGYRQKDNSMSYFHCENGEVTAKWQTTSATAPYYTEDYDVISNTIERTVYDGTKETETHSEVILKTNEPVGTKWNNTYEIVAKGQMIVYNGEIYNDVIVINDNNNDGENRFYAKGIGYVKTVFGSSERALIDLAGQKKLAEEFAMFKKGTIDKRLVGYWQNIYSGSEDVYTFRVDGTFERENDGNTQQHGLWRVQGDSIDCWGLGQTMHYKESVKTTVSPDGYTLIHLGFSMYKSLGDKRAVRLVGEADLEAICNNWCGIWELKEYNGKKYTNENQAVYMEIKSDGSGGTFLLKKGTNGKNLLASQYLGEAVHVSAWTELSKTVIYIFQSEQIAPSKGVEIDSKSVPKKLLIFSSPAYIYEYYGPTISFER